MSLSCHCDYDGDWEPGQVIWYSPSDYSELQTSTRKRCTSCKSMIEKGSIVGEIHRYQVPDDEIQERIYGEDGEIPRASKYMCEECCDIFFSLSDLGFCEQPGEDQHQLLNEYHHEPL